MFLSKYLPEFCVWEERGLKKYPLLCVHVREVCLHADGTGESFAWAHGCLPCACIPLVMCWKTTRGFHVIASSTKKKCQCHGKNQKGAQQGCLSGLFKEKMGSTGSSAQGPWASSATGRGAQTAHNLVIGRCECGDFAARE